MQLTDWLPMLPWEGPPLPRFLGIFWPWQGGAGEGFLALPAPRAMPTQSDIIIAMGHGDPTTLCGQKSWPV